MLRHRHVLLAALACVRSLEVDGNRGLLQVPLRKVPAHRLRSERATARSLLLGHGGEGPPPGPGNLSETKLDMPQETPMDMAIMGDVYVGTPPQHMTVILDSGSPDLWLPAADCGMCHKRAVPGNRFFEWTKSSTLGTKKYAVPVGTVRWAPHPGRCLDVAGGHPANGNHLQLWACLNGTNQQFLLPEPGTVGPIRWAAHPEKCVDVSAGRGRNKNGNEIQIWDCENRGHSPNQIFQSPKSGSGQIHWASHPGKCLDVVGGALADGTRVQLWDCAGGAANQLFRPRRLRSVQETAVRNIFFGTGRVEGTVATDIVRFAGLELKSQRLLLVEKEMFAPPDHVWDGILGLAKTEYSVIGNPFFTRLRDLGIAPLFVFIPAHTRTHVELRIGDAALHSPEISYPTFTWVPSEEKGLWYVNGRVGVNERSERRFLVDTGTTVIVMPPSDFKLFVDAIRPRRGCFVRGSRVTCACSDVPKMPPLMFEFGNVTMVLGALDLFQPMEKVMGGTFGDEPACDLQVSVGAESGGWLLGDNFLRKVVVAFDYERRRVGFAAPTEQSSLEIRVVERPGGPIVQTRLGRHPTLMKRRSTSMLVHLSAQLPPDGGSTAGRPHLARGGPGAALAAASAPLPMLLLAGACLTLLAAGRRRWSRKVTATAVTADSVGGGRGEAALLAGTAWDEEGG